MPITYTPLRYPGGKSKLYPFLSSLLKQNNLDNCIYVEPFAGGAGLALSLLMRNNVRQIIINDYDYSIYAFWHCILNDTERFIYAIERIPVTIDEWFKQREIQKTPNNSSLFEIGLSTFFLNRVNRSGIIKGGVIGGIEQNGQYKLDCRFNKTDLIRKIKKVASSNYKIQLYNMDVKDFITNIISALPKDTLVYFDPPYIVQGYNLYCNFFTEKDHYELSKLIKELRIPWILTYDKEPFVYSAYNDYKISELNLTYSAGSKRFGAELLVYSDQVSPLDHNLDNYYVNRELST